MAGPGTLPKRKDFPSSSLTIDIIEPPATHPPTNVLVLFHGLGDTQASFSKFARALALPETVCIALRAPSPLPFDLPGFHWGDDIIFDQATGDMDVDGGFKKCVKLVLDDIIRGTLINKCKYQPRAILLYGFGQGGTLALNVAGEMGNEEQEEEELGGVVSIGGALPLSMSISEVGRKSRTPVLLCKGDRGSAVKDQDVERLKDHFEFVEIKNWNKSGDNMPSNREEMLPIMQFFARRLRSLRGIPKGSVELTGTNPQSF